MLNGKQRRHLRALAHDLKPIVQVGKGGIDEGLIAAVDQALADHELIKIKIGEKADVDRHEAADQIAEQTHAEVAQVLGYTVVLYRADPEEPKIKLPRVRNANGAAPAAAEADDDGDDDDDDDDGDED